MKYNCNACGRQCGGTCHQPSPTARAIDPKDKQIQSLTAENAELKQRVEWVSVEDRLPEPDVEVACLIDSEHPVVGRNSSRFNCITYTGLAISGSVTHWMPLPSPPKQGEE